MDLLKYMAPKGLFKRSAAPQTMPVRPPNRGAQSQPVRPSEPIECIVDRYEANLPSIHKLICLNRELLGHRKAEMHAAEVQRAQAVRSFRFRALGALPLGTLALEMNQLSQAGLASAHASSVALLSGAAAVALACLSVVSLKHAARARGDKAILKVRQDELEGIIERESRAASRTLTALHALRQSPQPIEHDITQVIGADALCGLKSVRPAAFSDVVTPPPGWPHKSFSAPRPRPMGDDVASGTTFRLPH